MMMAFNFELIYSDNELSLAVPVKVKPIKAVDLVKELNVKSQTNDGKNVRYMTYTMDEEGIKEAHFKRGYVDSDNNLRAKQEIQFYIEVDGVKKFIKPFERGKKLEISMTIPKEDIEQFLTEKRYEVYSDKVALLWKLAQKLIEKKSIGVCKLSFGGFKEYFGLIRPVVKDKGFIMLMDLATQKIELENTMDIEKREEVKDEQLPTLSDLAVLVKKREQK
jgi:hypothetical protein